MNLKNKVLALGILCALSLPQAAGAEGFAINEWSAEGVAMGGARMFAEGDAANVAYNPTSARTATMICMTNTEILLKAGITVSISVLLPALIM